jgi:MoaA/NifB/PqqE/SkfB family radical SAM enzyme
MYRYQDIKDIHLEITSKCQARCPMCPRRENGGPLNPNMHLTEINLQTFKHWFSVDFIKQLHSLFMCGNLGDPIIAKDTLEIYQYLKECNPNIRLAMHTNGSARDIEWWKKLAQLKVKVTFGLDGLADTHSLYRISTDFNKIIENAQAFITAGGVAKWHMLVFAHNEHQIEQCRTMSKELGFQDFQIKHTTRFRNGMFNVIDDEGRTTHILYPTEKSKQMISKVEKSQSESISIISCKAKKNSQLYISATGTVTPCCWLDQKWYPISAVSRIDYMDKIGHWPNLNKQSLTEIFDSGYFNLISSCWNKTGLKECSKQCGSFDKLNEQFVERHEN